ncbi:MAG: cell division protein SepF [Heyndrickxia sp.]
MGLKSKIKTFFLLDDEYDDMEEEKMGHEEEHEPEPAPRYNQSSSKQNIVSLQSVTKGSKVVLIEPRVYAEAQEIADHLKNRRSVVVNLQRIQHDQAKRIIDFLSGTVYAIGGDIQRVGSNIFLCTPDNVEVSGNISELIQENNFDSRWS